MRLFGLSSVLSLVLVSSISAATAPVTFGAVPSQAQLQWSELEMYAFCHFTTNTFTDKEWGFGDESPSVFNPSAFDADQIVGTLAKCGFKGVILTCKHHDGFCLWPTKTTDHNVSKSPWKNGKGDVVREFSQAAARHGIQFGVYLSPWDRNNEHYGTPRYIEIYREQLTELLTNYGPVFEVWHDGANGGDGFYGGKCERRSIDRTSYYDWANTWKLVRKHQPNAVIFSDVGPDVRWVGNEHGISPYPNWATFSPLGPEGGPAAPGYCKTQEGSPAGRHWIPAEVDVSIRPGWFWHAHENSLVRSPKDLLNLYFNSVGRGSSFLLNVPPDRRGLIHENDVISMTGFKKALDQMFSKNLAAGAKVTADSNRGAGFEAFRMLDLDPKTYWAAPDGKLDATLVVTLPAARKFSVIRLREPVQLGQRIRKFAVDVRENGNWCEWINDGSTVGSHTLLRGKPVTADAVRVRITESGACPCLSEISLWLEPTGVPDSLSTADPKTLAKDDWKITASIETSDHPAVHVIDGNPATIWCTPVSAKNGQGPPQSISVDLGAVQDIAAVIVLPRQDGIADGMVDRYRLEWSVNGRQWSPPLEGEFSNLRANPVEQRISLPDGTKAKHLRFTGLHVLEKNHVTVAEFGVVLR
jgi:alpha-L-fucosidase